MLTVTAPVVQRAAHGPQYQHSSTCMYALPVSGAMASESSGQISTHSVQPAMHSDASMVTGTSALVVMSGTAASFLLAIVAAEVTAEDQPVTADPDVLKVHRPAIGQVRQALDQQHGGAGRGLEHGR